MTTNTPVTVFRHQSEWGTDGAEILLLYYPTEELLAQADATVAYLHDRFGYIPRDDFAERINAALGRHAARQRAEEGRAELVIKSRNGNMMTANVHPSILHSLASSIRLIYPMPGAR